MKKTAHIAVRTASTSAELLEAARLLVDFNTEYGEPAPPAGELATHLARLIAGGDTSILTVAAVGEADARVPPTRRETDARVPPAAGVAVLRFRTGTWSPALEAYLAEFYVRPALRGRGIGTAFLDAVIEHARARGASFLDLNTSESDEAARHVYEKRGFDCHEGRGSGPRALYYELDLD